MSKIIPAILTDNLGIFKNQIQQMEGIADLVQIDVSDGVFVSQKTLTAEEIKIVATPLHYELHLMAAHPSQEIEKWYDLLNLRKIIFHFEAVKIPMAVIEQIHAYGFQAGVAVNPATPLSDLQAIAIEADFITFMSVAPGQQGQKFIFETINKIMEFKKQHPQTPVEADGGLHEEEIKQLAQMGVEYLAVGSEIFRHSQPAMRLRELQNLINL